MHFMSILIKRLLYTVSYYCFYLVDFMVPKDKSIWIIASHSGLVSNSRFLAEFLLDNHENISLHLFTFKTNNDLSEKHFLQRYKGKFALSKKRNLKSLIVTLRAGRIFITHDVIRDVGFPIGTAGNRRLVVNLWHGITTKKQWLAKKHFLSSHKLKTLQFSKAIASSEIDAVAKTAIFQKPYDDIWVTGIPRNDILAGESKVLPEDLLQQEKALLEDIGGKRLVLYAPTWRKNARGLFPFQGEYLSQLYNIMEKNNAVLGLRFHQKDEEKYKDLYSQFPSIINLGKIKYPETQVLLRNTEVLVTDYSSIWIDFLLTDKPVIAFWHDMSEYQKSGGLLFDLPRLFPGPTACSCEDFLLCIEKTLAMNEESLDWERSYKHVKNLFHKYTDGKNTERLLQRVLRQ